MANQLEALPPELLAGLLTDAIEAFLDPHILAEDREVEERERWQIARAPPALTYGPRTEVSRVHQLPPSVLEGIPEPA